MILCGVVLVALIGIHSVPITQGQSHDDYSNQGDGCSFLRQGYFDHYGCTLECFKTTFGLEYMRGNLCTAYYELYSNDWGDVPFKKVVTVIECITINCRRAVPQAVCSNSYDKYQPQGNQNSSPTQPPAYSSSDSSNQNSQPVTQSTPVSSPYDKNNNDDAGSKSTSSTGSITTSQSPSASTSAYEAAMDQFMEEEFDQSMTTTPTDTTTDDYTSEMSTDESTPSTLDTTTCDSITDSTLTDAPTEAVTVSAAPPIDYTEEPCDDTPPANPDNNGGYPSDYNPANSNDNTQNNYNSYGSAVADSGGNSNDKQIQGFQNPGNQIPNNYNTNTNGNNNNNNNKFDSTYELGGVYQSPYNSNGDYMVSYIEKDYITQDQSGNSQPGNSGVVPSQNTGDNNLQPSLQPGSNQPANGQAPQNYQGAENNDQFYPTSYDNSAQPIQNPIQSSSAPTNVTNQNTSNNGIFSFLTSLIKPLASQPPTSKNPSTTSDQTVNNQTPGNYQGPPNTAQSGNSYSQTWSGTQGPNYQNQQPYPPASNIPMQYNSQPVDSSLFSGGLPPSSQGPSYQNPSQFSLVPNNYQSYQAPQSSSPVWDNSYSFLSLPQSGQGPNNQNPYASNYNYQSYQAPQSNSPVWGNSNPFLSLPQSSQGPNNQIPYASNNNYQSYPAPQSNSPVWGNSNPFSTLPQSGQGPSNQNPSQFPYFQPQSGPQMINTQNGGPYQGNQPVFTIKSNEDLITIFPTGEMVLTKQDGDTRRFKLDP